MLLNVGERFVKARTEYNINGPQTQKDAATGAGISASLLSEIENDKKPRDVGCFHIVTLAKYYGVSVDYLLGLSDVWHVDADIKTACKYTGLSDKAAESLKSITNKHAPALNAILGSDLGVKLIEDICKYINLREQDDYKYVVKDISGKRSLVVPGPFEFMKYSNKDYLVFDPNTLPEEIYKLWKDGEKPNLYRFDEAFTAIKLAKNQLWQDIQEDLTFARKETAEFREIILEDPYSHKDSECTCNIGECHEQ